MLSQLSRGELLGFPTSPSFKYLQKPAAAAVSAKSCAPLSSAVNKVASDMREHSLTVRCSAERRSEKQQLRSCAAKLSQGVHSSRCCPLFQKYKSPHLLTLCPLDGSSPVGCEAGVVYTVTVRCATVRNVDYILLLANYTVDFRNLSIENCLMLLLSSFRWYGSNTQTGP